MKLAEREISGVNKAHHRKESIGGRLLGQPSTVRPGDLKHYFGIAAKTFYNWSNTGRLRLGHHYYKVGEKMILVDFVNFENFLKGKE